MTTRRKISGQVLSAKALALREGPKSATELASMDEAACMRLAAVLRWPEGARCPVCSHGAGVELDASGRVRCPRCREHSPAVRGSALQRLPASLPQSLRALWELLETAHSPWGGCARPDLDAEQQIRWLSEVRAIMRLATSEPLRGVVEVARIPVEVWRWDREGQPQLTHLMLALAVELRDHGFGDVRLARLEQVDALGMTRFVRRSVAPGSCVRTGTWRGYERLSAIGYRHVVCFGDDENCDGNPESAEQLSSIIRLWLWSVPGFEDLGEHLDELVFRLNHQDAARERGALFRRFVELALRAADGEPGGRTLSVSGA